MTIYTFPANKPFLNILAHRLRDESTHNPLSMANTIVFLPTRRACRTLKENIYSIKTETPIILPRLLALGDIESDSEIQSEWQQYLGANLPALLPPIHPMKRRFKLAKMCMGIDLDGGQPNLSFPQALELADALAVLLDELQREQVDFTSIDTLAPEEYAEHWQSILRFLNIITRYWPNILAEENEQDPVAYRNQILENITATWKANPPNHRIIIAGSTASNLATAKLMQVVARLPNGEIILPAVNPAIEKSIWEAVHGTHPSFFLKQFLALAEYELDAVRVLDHEQVEASCALERIRLAETAMLPASKVHYWATFKAKATALQDIECITHDSPQIEAETIALICKQAFAQNAQKICIVCEDASLKAELRLALDAYGITADASEGMTLAESTWANFMRLMIAAAEDIHHPLNLLALLKHPYAWLSASRAEVLRAARYIELHILRTELQSTKLSLIKSHLQKMEDNQAKNALIILERYEKILTPLHQLIINERTAFLELCSTHIYTAEQFAMHTDGICDMWLHPANQAAQHFTEQLQKNAHHIGSIDPSGYALALTQLMAREPYSEHQENVHAVRILPSAEARLETADVMIVAGMNEGSWPKSLAANPWMSRPMQATLGLHMPEVNSSRMAHDVMMIMHAPRVVFSRAIKEHGAETLESRWLQRLRACCHALPANTFAHVFNNATYSAWLEQIKQADRNVSPVTRPEPKPPVSVRPTSFSVTALERLQRDPYAIYAERILRLRPLEPLGDMAQHKIFGNLVHHMLEIWSAEFLTTNASTLSNKTKEKLIDNAIAQYALDETQRYIWHPKLSAILDWVISTHEARSSNILEVKAEQQLNMKIQGKHTEYTIKGRADRIEIARDGRVVVVDYKTGTVPTKKDITNFIACQLPLECLMLMQMETHNQNSIASFEHWALSSKAGKARIIPADKKLEMNTFLAEIKTHITHLLDRYMDVEMAYAAVPDESLKPRYHTYAQLERYAEWI